MDRINLLGTEMSSPTSGQARFIFNLAQGLSTEGLTVTVVLYGSAGPRAGLLESRGIRVIELGQRVDSAVGQFRRMTRWGRAGADVARAIDGLAPADWNIVLADDLVSAAAQSGKGRWAYISNGDMALLLLNRSFVAGDRVRRGAMSLGASDLIRRHATDAEAYDRLLANSGFTRQLMSYLYGIPFAGIVYPPVDTSVFRPASLPPSAPYVLAVARNNSEQGLSLLRELAREVPLRVVGGAHVDGAEDLGTVPDEALPALYSGATLLAFPAVSEPYGYAVAEALCCGAPVVVFDTCGPGELVGRTGGGWLCSVPKEFVAQARSAFRAGVTAELRGRAATAANVLSIQQSTRSLLEALVHPTSADAARSSPRLPR